MCSPWSRWTPQLIVDESEHPTLLDPRRTKHSRRIDSWAKSNVQRWTQERCASAPGRIGARPSAWGTSSTTSSAAGTSAIKPRSSAHRTSPLRRCRLTATATDGQVASSRIPSGRRHNGDRWLIEDARNVIAIYTPQQLTRGRSRAPHRRQRPAPRDGRGSVRITRRPPWSLVPRRAGPLSICSRFTDRERGGDASHVMIATCPPSSNADLCRCSWRARPSVSSPCSGRWIVGLIATVATSTPPIIVAPFTPIAVQKSVSTTQPATVATTVAAAGDGAERTSERERHTWRSVGDIPP